MKAIGKQMLNGFGYALSLCLGCWFALMFFGAGMTSSLRVSLVIPVYNQVVHTMQCLESIQRLPDRPEEIIVVDNGSTDDTAEYLKSVRVKVITNATNLGSAKAWNQGIQAGKGDVVGLLNNDIVVTAGWLTALLAFMERTNVGIVSPAMRLFASRRFMLRPTVKAFPGTRAASFRSACASITLALASIPTSKNVRMSGRSSLKSPMGSVMRLLRRIS